MSDPTSYLASRRPFLSTPPERLPARPHFEQPSAYMPTALGALLTTGRVNSTHHVATYAVLVGAATDRVCQHGTARAQYWPYFRNLSAYGPTPFDALSTRWVCQQHRPCRNLRGAYRRCNCPCLSTSRAASATLAALPATLRVRATSSRRAKHSLGVLTPLTVSRPTRYPCDY